MKMKLEPFVHTPVQRSFDYPKGYLRQMIIRFLNPVWRRLYVETWTSILFNCYIIVMYICFDLV